MGANEKKQVLISLIKELLKSVIPIKVELHKNQTTIETYLYSIEVAGDTTLDLTQKLKAALKHLRNSNDISKLTVRLLTGKTEYGIDKQINFLDNRYTNIQIA